MNTLQVESNLSDADFAKRYDAVSENKAGGIVYTPQMLAKFVSQKIVEYAGTECSRKIIRILDPAMGNGELLVNLLDSLNQASETLVEVHGFDTDSSALKIASNRLAQQFPAVTTRFQSGNFLNFVLEQFGQQEQGNIFQTDGREAYDIIIANPPYVRTQVLGSSQAKLLSEQFGLSGRIDLYFAFIIGISQVLKQNGTAGIIVSNRFMTTKSGAFIRQAILERFNVLHAWDLGDTKLFNAAVLPAVLIVQGKGGTKPSRPKFTSIYQSSASTCQSAANPISALEREGVVKISDGRNFLVQHGELDTNDKPGGVWRVGTASGDAWLKTVDAHRACTFKDIGKVRVGVKTCADKVFVRSDWHEMAEKDRPELLRPIITHHVAQRYKSLVLEQPKFIIYPHEVVNGLRRAVDLTRYPRSYAYLISNKNKLESRKYLIEASRCWYEIWVPQDPLAWNLPKLVFRDIAQQPTFWIDLDGSVVNGDCYWIVCQKPKEEDLLWLAVAVANSTLIERYYDLRFHNKLYAGRRRFITQYVEKFPLPDPQRSICQSIIEKSKLIYRLTPKASTHHLQQELNSMVWQALTGDPNEFT